jgi:hypothetical protein
MERIGRDGDYVINIQRDAGWISGTILRWATEVPNKAGWYWAIRKEDGKAIVVEAFVMGREHEYICFRSGWDSNDEFEFTHWLGPLPEPVTPKG